MYSIILAIRIWLEGAACPLPHVARQIVRAVGAGVAAIRVCPHRRGRFWSALVGVRARLVPLVPPRIDTSIRAAHRFLPFRLRRQPPRLPGLSREPGGIGDGVAPRDVDDRVVEPGKLRLPVARLLLRGTDEAGVLGDGDGIPPDGEGVERDAVLR